MSSYFIGNALGSRCLIPFEGYHLSPLVGGAIVAYLNDVNIANSNFVGNRANLGAAIFGYYSKISIISSSFADNHDIVTYYNCTSVHNHCIRPSDHSHNIINEEASDYHTSSLQKISYELGSFYLASVIATFNTTVRVNGSHFSNKTSTCGGVMCFFSTLCHSFCQQ